jgi:DNA polymerase-3 subunit delta
MQNHSEIFPVYFLYGPEEFLIEGEIQRLLDQTLSPKERGFNLHIFSGEEHDGQEITQAAQTVPMFSQHRFVLVKEADRVDDEKLEAILRYIQNPSPSTCFVLWGQTLGPWKRSRSQIEKVGKVMEYARLKGKALTSWVRGRMAAKGKTLSEDAAGYLVEVVGDTLSQLENALEKAYLSVGEKRTVDLSDMEGTLADVKTSTVFDLTDAIGRQEVDRALHLLEKVMEARAVTFRKDEEASKVGDPIPLLLSMMVRQYRLIWKVKSLSSEELGLGGIAKELRMSPWMVRNLLDQAKNFSVASLRDGVLKCHGTDLAIKRGRGPKELLMEKLVIDLCHPGERQDRGGVRRRQPLGGTSSAKRSLAEER